jgi:hypothetical protein
MRPGGADRGIHNPSTSARTVQAHSTVCLTILLTGGGLSCPQNPLDTSARLEMTRMRGFRGRGASHAGAGQRPKVRAWLAVLVAGMAIAGCAPKFVAVNPTQRVELDGVSVLPPVGQTWYVGPHDGRHVIFGRRPPQPPHTVAAGALVDKIEIGGAVLGPVRNAQDLKEVTERRLQSGGRFTTIEASVRPDTSNGAECVRVDAVQEERDNPRLPGVVLVLVSHALDCLHPQSPGYVVSVSYSERYPKGQQAWSAEILQAEGEPFIHSALFRKVR